MKTLFQICVWVACGLLPTIGVGGSPSADAETILADVLAPTVVGVPPRDAVRDLCETSEGELRHYGRKLVGGEVRPAYVASRDGGLNWTLHLAEKDDVGALVKSPYSGDWISWKMSSDKDHHMFFCRSKIGPGDTKPEIRPYPEYRWLELRQLVPLRSRRRWVAAFSDVGGRFEETGDCYHAVLLLSDDDGKNWRRVSVKPVAGVQLRMPGDQRHRWYNDGCEPTLAELTDGTLLMAVRTSGPNAAFYRSADGGETWSDGRPDEAFWQSNTMPYLFRLRDGRIVFLWNNTQSLPTRPVEADPELHREEQIGVWESFFTNRDALHAAISEDDGRTWIGFRELALSEDRGSASFRELGNWPDDSHDKSVHQSQAIELKDGKVLVAYGQNGSTRRLVVFDPKWLYEKSRTEDFRHGLENLSTHLYITSLLCGYRGFSGHSACNRAPGAMLVRDPLTNRNTCRQVLQLCRIRDPRLVSDRQGVVWNFPAARKGRVEISCRIVGAGFRLSLLDHWINPCDDFNAPLSPVTGEVTQQQLGDDAWHMVSCDWDSDDGRTRFSCDGRVFFEGKMKSVPRFGLSYLHLQTLAEETDPHGTYFRSFSEKGR